MNQAVFERFLVGEDGATEAKLSGTFGVLLAPDIIQPADADSFRTSRRSLPGCSSKSTRPV